MTSAKLRIIGSALLLTGYCILLYVDVLFGCWFRLLGGVFMLPFAVKIKVWDVVGIQSFFAAIDLSKIIQLTL